jgi:nicotinic acid mononucleotide adenylyltransferase
MKKIVFTFGRYNPPTTGHAELILYTANLAKRTGADHRIYTSQSHDPSKNPLSPKQKMAFLRQIFPGVNFVDDPSMKTAFAIAKKLSDEGYEDVTFVVGSDRVNEFSTQLSKYVKPRTAKDFDPKKHYPFKKFQVVSSGARKKGISGTDLRNAVRKGDFATFAKASAARDKTLARKIYSATKSQLNEEMTRKEFDSHLKRFIDFTCQKLDIKEVPSLKYKEPTDQGEQPSFAAYSPGSKEVIIMTKNRHPMDVFRSVAHELVHHKQNEDGKLGKDVAKEGATGSPIEDEANYMAGRVMRWFGKANPDMFGKSYVIESKAIILSGVPGSGKDKILKETILPHGYIELSSETYNTPTDRLVVVNGTANYERIRFIKEDLEKAGYETIMVFVNTSNDVSRQRNEARAEKGGRVINEAVRFTKWKNAQDTLDRYDDLFERVIVVQNDLDLNQPLEVIQETHNKLVEMVSEDIRQFSLAPVDRKFESMLEGYSDFSPIPKNNPVGGAGNWGTSKLTDRYKKDTPGQFPGKTIQMGYFQPRKEKTKVKVFGNLPKFGDRLGPTYTSAKNPSFVGDITSDQNVFMPGEPMQKWSAIDRWMMKEETRKRFKEKYGKLAEQKMKETVNKLRKESLVDPYMGSLGMTPNASNIDDVRPDINAEFEKMTLFGKRKSKKTK